jgi:hypothetical protein
VGAVSVVAAKDIHSLDFDFSCIDRCGHAACVGRINDIGRADRTVPAVGTVPVSMHDQVFKRDLADHLKSMGDIHEH